jgi:hypothetical protein
MFTVMLHDTLDSIPRLDALFELLQAELRVEVRSSLARLVRCVGGRLTAEFSIQLPRPTAAWAIKSWWLSRTRASTRMRNAKAAEPAPGYVPRATS